MTFRVGQKVVCVDDVFTDIRWRSVPNKPIAGVIYTVRSVLGGWFHSGADGLLLNEIVNPIVLWDFGEMSEGAFYTGRFRPIVDSHKSVSFTAGAPKDSEKWDNRKKVVSPRHRVRVNG